jgi:hypothetical protein
MFSPNILRGILLTICAAILTGCGGGNSAAIQLQIDARNAQIAAEPPGDYFVGRRFRIERTHLWGYVRRPGEQWDKARLVVIDENFVRQPDRLPEEPTGESPAYGFDHNYEYRLWGSFTGKKVYDPNSDLVLPEFRLARYELINRQAGWLFKPNERFNGYQLLRAEPGAVP